MTDWRSVFTRARLSAHEEWLDGGRNGPGRFELEGLNLGDARSGGVLSGARWVRCDLGGAVLELSEMRETELMECLFREANLRGCDLEGATLQACRFSQANLRMIDLVAAQVRECDFGEAQLERSSWTGSVIERCGFAGACLQDSVFDQAQFSDCDFRSSDLSWTQGPPLGTARKTRFVRCDFRGADFSRLRLTDTFFQQCGFHGVKGKPSVQGLCLITNPDFSAAFDGSDIRPNHSPWTAAPSVTG